MEMNHERYMRQTIALAADVPERPFAALIADRVTGNVIAEGRNQSDKNPTWHGEIDAINRLAADVPGIDYSKCVLYTTAEPCPMCQGAILWAGIGSVVFGTSIRFLIDIGWRQIDIPAEEVVRRDPGWQCLIVGGILKSECNELFLRPRVRPRSDMCAT
jgi:tRNA(Arg) A34 adenosine deaminase TadA